MSLKLTVTGQGISDYVTIRFYDLLDFGTFFVGVPVDLCKHEPLPLRVDHLLRQHEGRLRRDLPPQLPQEER